MGTYMLFSTLTPEGRQTLHANPDRVLGVNQEVEDFGCKVIAQYATLGQFDFVTIIEAADGETVAHLSIDLGSRGTVNVWSVPALSVEELRTKLKAKEQLAAARSSVRKTSEEAPLRIEIAGPVPAFPASARHLRPSIRQPKPPLC